LSLYSMFSLLIFVLILAASLPSSSFLSLNT
jgi:hypothetical protein